jgi:hypothetical protein
MRLNYRTSLAPEVAAARLREKVDAITTTYLIVPGVTKGKAFVGRVSDERFDIRVRQTGRNSLAPSAVGQIQRTGGGSEIVAQVGVGRAISHALGVFLVLIAVLCAPAALVAGASAVATVGITACCAVAGVLVWMRGPEDLGFPRSEADALKNLLDATFGTTAEPR